MFSYFVFQESYKVIISKSVFSYFSSSEYKSLVITKFEELEKKSEVFCYLLFKVIVLLYSYVRYLFKFTLLFHDCSEFNRLLGYKYMKHNIQRGTRNITVKRRREGRL